MHNIVFAGNGASATELLKVQDYDILHLAYDLGNGTNSEKAAFYIGNTGIKSLGIINSGHPQGVENIIILLPAAFSIAFTLFHSKHDFSNQLKLLLCISEIPSMIATSCYWTNI